MRRNLRSAREAYHLNHERSGEVYFRINEFERENDRILIFINSLKNKYRLENRRGIKISGWWWG